MRHTIERARDRLRSISRLGQALIVTGLLGLLLPGTAFLLQDEEFGPEETREHIGTSLEKVRHVKGVYQQIENRLEEAESKTQGPGETLSADERRALEQLSTGGRSKWSFILSLDFLQFAVACAFFLLAGVALERHYLAPRKSREPAPPAEPRE